MKPIKSPILFVKKIPISELFTSPLPPLWQGYRPIADEGRLLEILLDDIGIVTYSKELMSYEGKSYQRIVFKQKLKPDKDGMINIGSVAMRLVGKISEAVIVRSCRENQEINQRLMELAIGKKIDSSMANRYIAIGTGLRSTKKEYPQEYNYTDSQRDIVWINKNHMLALVAGSTAEAGDIAGLQIKTSIGNKQNLVRDFVCSRYKVPVLYISLIYGFDKLKNKVMKRGGEVNNLFDIEKYAAQAYLEIKGYHILIYQMLRGDTVGIIPKGANIREAHLYKRPDAINVV